MMFKATVVIPKNLRVLHPSGTAVYNSWRDASVNELRRKSVDIAKVETPIGGTSGLINSVRSIINGRTVTGSSRHTEQIGRLTLDTNQVTSRRNSVIVIEWGAPYARPVESGHRAHLVPISSFPRIQQWTGFAWGDASIEAAYRFRRLLARRRTKGRFYANKARNAIQRFAFPLFRTRISQLRRILSGDLT